MKIFTFSIFLFYASFSYSEIPIIVISPSKYQESLNTVGSSISVINNKEIDESKENFISDIIDLNIGGTNYFRSGGHGTVSGIQIRGLPKRYSTVYIDGVKMSDPSSSDNSYYFSNLMTSSVDNIEILKGSQSTIYGSGAIGGTINLNTKNGKSKKNKVFNVENGSNNSKKINISYGNDLGKSDYYLSFSKYLTDGISAMNDDPANNDDDAYKNNSFSAKYNIDFDTTNSLKASLRYSDSFLEYDEVTAGRSDNNNSSKDDELSFNLKFIQEYKKLKNTYSYNYYQINRATKTYDSKPKNYYGYRNSFSIQNEYNFNLDNKIIFGVENEFDAAKFQKDWPTNYLEADEAIYSQYFDYKFRSNERLTSTIGIRRDYHTTAKTHYSKRLTSSYQIDNTKKIRASIGSGLRYPSLYEYFYGTTVTNKEDLRPEKSNSIDLGFEKKFPEKNLAVSIDMYKITYKDPLEGWASHSWKIRNANAKVKSNGIDIRATYKPVKKLSTIFNFNFNRSYDGADCDNPDKSSSECINESMVRVPKYSSNLILDYDITQKLNSRIAIKFRDKTRDYGNTNNGFKDVMLDDYIVFDFDTNYEINNNYSFYFKINNLFDTKYETAYMYSSMDRNLNFGFKKNF